ncbi:hypothetical protein V9T40_003013 [Parthenolecanium corni]|uniref:Transferrin-like domain-containing protein n=1 Tax=Parthenolecanium corni TaxID=536013 RepID=A0AAN9U0M1_9HEMI
MSLGNADCGELMTQETNDREKTLVWCTVSIEEQYKCLNFSAAVQADAYLFRSDYHYHVSCKQASNKKDCMTLLDQEIADITSLDAGDVFLGGRYHSLLPILQEIYPGDEKYFYSVAVIKKNSLTDVYNLHNLRNRKACFPSVGSLAGWVIPIETLMREGGLEIIDCNNHVKSAIKFFGPSCAVNSLSDEFNPAGDNSDKLCQICTGAVPGGKCTPSDPYAGFSGAFRCLIEAGEIAFLRHTTVKEMIKNHYSYLSMTENDFELLCKDGSRRPVGEYHNCNWGKVTSDAIVSSSAKSSDVRKKYQAFLQTAARLYASVNETTANYNANSNLNIYSRPYSQNSLTTQTEHSNSTFHLFQSAPQYGNVLNLLIQDYAVDFFALDETQQTYTSYLGKFLESIMYVRKCTVDTMSLCVTSDPEMEKCIKMKVALQSQLLKPEMQCFKARSHVHCMQAIRNRDADVAVFDSGDIYTAGLQYDEIPIIAEVYNLGTPEFYVVAVAKEEDPSTEMTYLKGKYTCHTGVFTGAGWIIPLAYLISNGWIRNYGCDSVHAAAEYFGKSCVPGALSPEYASSNVYENLCHLCHGASYRYCRRDASEDYYGYTGAFRCLVEGGGNVAFVKHTTVYENTDGKRKEWWARNALNTDYQLLCPDGTRATLEKYEKCNMGKVRANAVVTRGGSLYNETEISAFTNLFVYAQQFYSRKDGDEFSLFSSPPPYSDLIFQDATQQLRVIEPDTRYYDRYLGNDFMRARRIVDCHAKGSILQMSFSLILVCAVLLFAN